MGGVAVWLPEAVAVRLREAVGEPLGVALPVADAVEDGVVVVRGEPQMLGGSREPESFPENPKLEKKQSSVWCLSNLFGFELATKKQ